MPARLMTNSYFLREFMQRHEYRSNRPFCWLLGAGASRESGISTGGELAKRWLEEMRDSQVPSSTPIDVWIASADRKIEGLTHANAADHYSEIYNLRFANDPDGGHAYLEKEMATAKPSFGYAVLARIMEKTAHKAAITTNFDDLIANAISVFTDTMAHVCFHESLTRYIRIEPRRPFVAKIHRDLFHDAKNTDGETKKLEEQWVDTLQKIFQRFTPIVIGYAGNDGSLMGFLEKLVPIEGGIFWCYREANPPSDRVQKVVAKHNGWLVPIEGFDAIMTQLGNLLKCTPTCDDLKATFDKRLDELMKKFVELEKKPKEPTPAAPVSESHKLAREAVDAVGERMKKEKSWWAWQLKADAEKDPAKQEAIYREGMKDFSESAELTGNFALFMATVRKDNDEAERLYRRALELDPKHANHTGNFANFMKDARKDNDEAERLYRRALELDPKHANITGNFALFMQDVRKDNDEAERLYRRALELDPKDATHTGNFASFMQDVRKDNDEAERLYRRALELDPKHANHTGNYAEFLWEVRKNNDEAERLYRRALELAPDSPDRMNGLGWFLTSVRKKYDEAEPLLRKAHELAPDDGNICSSLAVILTDMGKQLEEAERLHRRAVELSPENAECAWYFGRFMENVRKNIPEAERLYERALELEPDNAEWQTYLAAFRGRNKKK